MRVIIFFTFFTDIKKVHPNIHEEILAEQKAVKMKKEAFNSITKQTILDEGLRFIVNEALPLSKIDSPHFWNFVHGE